ncbi:hypothetical protein [Muricoccus radiodurans]|uniref:hypothetical protein n=1 Tax=Muricoccus radiodurans TaxID=2231721 RepID=UPI003CF330FD
MTEPGRAARATGIHVLGTTTDARLPAMPQIPTVKGSGVDLAVTKFRGLGGPKGVPNEIAVLWESALRRLPDDPADRATSVKESLGPRLLGRAEARSFTTEFSQGIAASPRELGVLR